MDQSISCLEPENGTELSNFSSEDIQYENRISEVCVPLTSHPELGVLKQNILESSGVHIGATFVSIKQNVEQITVVHDLPFWRYICHLAKRTTKLERMICAVALFILVMCVALLVYFSKEVDLEDEDISKEARGWLVERKKWLSRKVDNTELLHQPIPLVVISHTVSAACYSFLQCAAAVKNIQNYYLDKNDYDIPYNFLIGTDGSVYEGLGWNIVGYHTLGYNECSIGLAFIGDYREGLPSYTKITELQIQRVHKLFEVGLEQGYLHTQFKVLGMRDLRATASPGDNIFNEIRKWSNYDHKNVFKGHTCNEIFDFFQNKNVTSDATP